MFRHPIIITSDPAIAPGGDLTLGWYIGRKQGPSFDDHMTTVVSLAKEIAPDAKIGTFGSSGGGFAAIMAAVKGYSDSALAINPQTNILNYRNFFVRKFLRYYGEEQICLGDSDMSRLAISDALKVSDHKFRVRVVVNTNDDLHLNKHVIPLACAVGGASGFEFFCYDDDKQTHNPPSNAKTMWLMNKFWRRCVFPDYGKHLRGIKSLRRLNTEALSVSESA